MLNLLRKPCRENIDKRLLERLKTRITIFFFQRDHRHDELVDGGGDFLADLARLFRRAFKTFLDDGDGVLALEWGDARQSVVKRRTKRIHIRAKIERLFLHLLRRNVIGRAPDFLRILLHRGEAEVNELRIAIRVEKNILGLHIAVDDTLVGRALKRKRRLLANLENALNVSLARRGVHEREERTARGKLHCDVGHALADAVAVDLNDVRVNEARGGLRLLLKLLNKCRVCAEFLQHDLDGDRAIEHFVAPHIDAAHAARAKLALKEKVSVVAENARQLNELLAHRIILHPLNGQKTNDASPRRFARGTAPQ